MSIDRPSAFAPARHTPVKHQIPIALRETLDSVVSPEVRDALLADALRDARESELPTDPAHFRKFADGPLRRALQQGLGPELAGAIVEELSRVADLVERHAPGKQGNRRASASALRAVTPPRHPSRPPRRSLSPRAGTLRSLQRALGTPPPWSGPITKPPSQQPVASGPVPRPFDRLSTPPAPSEIARLLSDLPAASVDSRRSIPFILVASKDANLTRRLTSWLDPRAALVTVHTVSGLLHSLEDTVHARSVILLDCRAPSVRATAVAALADDLSKNVQVVLWGATPELQRTLLLISARTAEWVVCKSDARAKEVAERCFGLVS